MLQKRNTTITESCYNVKLFFVGGKAITLQQTHESNKNIELEKINTTINYFVTASTPNPRE